MKLKSRSREEQLEQLRRRYEGRGAEGKSCILDELCEAHGYHRKHAVRLLNGSAVARKSPPRNRGQPKIKKNRGQPIEKGIFRNCYFRFFWTLRINLRNLRTLRFSTFSFVRYYPLGDKDDASGKIPKDPQN